MRSDFKKIDGSSISVVYALRRSRGSCGVVVLKIESDCIQTESFFWHQCIDLQGSNAQSDSEKNCMLKEIGSKILVHLESCSSGYR